MTAPRSRATFYDLVDQLFDAAFDAALARSARSAEYKEGVRAVLAYRVHGMAIRCPHPMGTASADAFYSGITEGHALWRRHLEANAAGNGASDQRVPR